MRFIIVFIIFAFTVTAAKERGESCVTPTQEMGKCIPVKECSTILNALSTSINSTTVEFARQSQCGYDSQPLVCCAASAVLQPASNNRGILPDDICGEHSLDAILGGNITHLTEYPWLAALEYKDKTNNTSVGIKCDGALITKRHVLTAAHCIATKNDELFRVWLGDHTLSTDPDCEDFIAYTICADPVKKLNIEYQIPHPYYNPISGENDIGLLRLEDDIEFTEFVRPICVPNAHMPDLELSTHLLVSGWNLLQKDLQLDGKFISVVTLLSQEDCLAKKPFSESCLTRKYNVRGVCWQASGGPLMREYSSGPDIPRVFQEGIISGAIACDQLLYTSVYPYRKWIVDTIKGI